MSPARLDLSDDTALTSTFVGRDQEFRQLAQVLARPGAIAEVLGPWGVGKTALLKSFEIAFSDLFPGGSHWFTGSEAFPLSAAIDVLAQDLRARDGNHLLVVDDADRLDAVDIQETIARLSAGPWSFATALISRRPLRFGDIRVDVRGLNQREFERFFRMRFADSGPLISELYDAAKGNPRLATQLGNLWREGAGDLQGLVGLLSPWRHPGLYGPNGQPITARASPARRIITEVRHVSEEMLRRAAMEPSFIYEMPSRRFEELVAELFERRGYDVTLTPATRDGGKDMYAAKRDDIGSFLYIVECKRHAPDRPVGVGVVRALHGVAQSERANAAIVVTTSTFSAPARNFAEELKWQMTLRDYQDLRGWLDAFRK